MELVNACLWRIDVYQCVCLCACVRIEHGISWLIRRCWDRAPFITGLETRSGTHSAKHKQGGLFFSYLWTMHHQNKTKKKSKSSESGGPSVGGCGPNVVGEPLKEWRMSDQLQTQWHSQRLANADEEVYLCTTKRKGALPALLITHPSLLLLHIHNSWIGTVWVPHTAATPLFSLYGYVNMPLNEDIAKQVKR